MALRTNRPAGRWRAGSRLRYFARVRVTVGAEERRFCAEGMTDSRVSRVPQKTDESSTLTCFASMPIDCSGLVENLLELLRLSDSTTVFHRPQNPSSRHHLEVTVPGLSTADATLPSDLLALPLYLTLFVPAFGRCGAERTKP